MPSASQNHSQEMNSPLDFQMLTNFFNAKQSSDFLNSSFKRCISKASDNQIPPNERPIFYKPKASGSVWGSKDASVNKTSPWGNKKGAKLANGNDLVSELKKLAQPVPAPTAPAPTKKTLTTTKKL